MLKGTYIWGERDISFNNKIVLILTFMTIRLVFKQTILHTLKCQKGVTWRYKLQTDTGILILM